VAQTPAHRFPPKTHHILVTIQLGGDQRVRQLGARRPILLQCGLVHDGFLVVWVLALGFFGGGLCAAAASTYEEGDDGEDDEECHASYYAADDGAYV
jgi:hypothetical protein